MEVDLEYSGGLLLEIETKLGIQDQDIQQGMVDPNALSHSTENPVIFEGVDDHGRHSNLSEGTVDSFLEKKDENNSKPGQQVSF